MADTVPRRERPVDASNRYPRGAAYACVTEKDNIFAENWFRSAYQEQFRGQHGPYANSTIAIFNNWIIALIKLYRYDEAEESCRNMLQSLETSGMQESTCFVCVQCNLAASLYLSGHLPAAEDLFDTIRARQDVVSNDSAIGFFEVLSLVRLTTTDCLVFRECSASFAGLVLVNDYTALRDGKHPKKPSWRSSIGSLRRFASLGQGFGQVGLKRDADNLDGPGALLKRVFRFGRGLLDSTTPRLGSISTSTLPVTSSDEVEHQATVSPVSWPINNINSQAATNTGDAKHPSQSRLTDISDSSDEIDFDPDTDLAVAWGNVSFKQMPAEHTLRPPSTLYNSFDTTQSGTHRSQQTTTSSQDADSEDMNLFPVTAWATDHINRTEMQLNALLDDGSRRNLASLAFAHTINARILPAEDVRLSNPDGTTLEHIGRIKVSISFKGPAGTQIGEIRCLVVKNLETALLIGRRIIYKFDLKGAGKLAIFGPILLNSRSKKEKRDNKHESNAIAAARKEQNEHLAAARKAERAMTAAPSTPAANAAPAKPKTSPPARGDSPLGGSDTTTGSPRSSMTFHRRSNTTSTAASSPSRSTNSSDSYRPSGFSASAATIALPPPSDVSRPLQHNPSRHRRPNAQDLNK